MILDTALEYELSPFRQGCCLDISSETHEKSRVNKIHTSNTGKYAPPPIQGNVEKDKIRGKQVFSPISVLTSTLSSVQKWSVRRRWPESLDIGLGMSGLFQDLS